MNLFGIELTNYSLIGAAIMLVIGLIDYMVVNWALKLGERQALKDGTVTREKTQTLERVRLILSIACFLVFPVIGLLVGNRVLSAIL